MITDLLVHVSDVPMFWGVLWAGLVFATVSLWAALYRPSQDAGLAGWSYCAGTGMEAADRNERARLSAIPPLTWRYLQYTHGEEGARL
jgi:hypothetical protein